MKFILLATTFGFYGILLGKDLSFTSIEHSQITITKEITSILRIEDNLYETGDFEDFFVKAKYNPKPGPKELPFGSLKNDTDYTERISFPKRIGSGYWRGVAPFENDLIFLEGRKKKVLVYFGKDNFSIFSDIIMDRFIPAGDSRGQATKWEVGKSRTLFVKNLSKLGSGEIALTGIAPIPQSWGGKTMEFFILSRVQKFPLFIMSCSAKDGIVCQLNRQCFVEGVDSNEDLTGLTVSEKRREILLLSHGRQKLIVLSYKSCYQVNKSEEISLPKKINKIRSIYVDKGDALWLGADFPDNYLNSSVYKLKSW